MLAIQLDDLNPMAAEPLPPRRRPAAGYHSAGPASGCGTGTSARTPTAQAPPISTPCGTTCSPLTFDDDLPASIPARRREPVVRRSSATCSGGPGRGGTAKSRPASAGRAVRRAAPGDAGRPRRADPAAGAGQRRLDLGHLHRLDLHDPTLGGSGIGPSSGSSTATAGRSTAARRRSTRRRGTRRTGTTSSARPRCAWSCRWPTGTTRGGSTSRASPATPSTTTTPTRPTSASAARPCPGRSPRRRRAGR